MFFFGKKDSLPELIKAGRTKKLSTLITAENCNEPDADGHAPLYYAVAYDQSEIARFLLALGSQPVTGAEHLQQPVMEHVLMKGSQPLVELFMEYGEPFPSKIGNLPLLHALVTRENLDEAFLTFIINQGFDINVMDETQLEETTAFAYYLNQGKVAIDAERMRLLIRLGADVNRAHKQAHLPVVQVLNNLTLTTKPSDPTLTTAVQTLIEGGLNFDAMPAPGRYDQPISGIAMANRQYQALLVLLDHGLPLPQQVIDQYKDDFTEEQFGKTGFKKLREIDEQRDLNLPVNIALLRPAFARKKIAALTVNDEKVNRFFFDLIGASGWVLTDKLSQLTELLNKGADINQTQQWALFDLTPLQYAVVVDDLKNRDELVDWLLEQGADIESGGFSALYAALWYKRPSLVRRLIEYGADTSFEDRLGGTLFSWMCTPNLQGQSAIQEEDIELLQLLHTLFQEKGQPLPLQQPFKFSFDNPYDLDETMLLPSRVIQYDIARVQPLLTTLLAIGWPLNERIEDKYSDGNIVANMCRYAKPGDDISPILHSLTDLDVGEPAGAIANLGGGALRQAISHAMALPTIEALLTFTDDVNFRIERQFNGQLQSKNQSLLSFTFDVLTAKEHDEDYICQVMTLLLEKGAHADDVIYQTYLPEMMPGGRYRKELTALESAATLGLFKVFKLLLDYGADPLRPMCYFQEHFIHLLVSRTDHIPDEAKIPYIEELEKRGLFDVEDPVVNNNNATPLSYTASKCRVKLTQYLLNKNANPNAIGGFDNAPILHRAISNWNWVGKDERAATVRLLLDAGADTTMIDPDGDTPLMSAAAYGCLSVVDVLLAHGADANLGNENGLKPIHSAIIRAASYDEYPDDPACRDENEQHEPLKIAIIKQLLAHGADINAATENGGDTPLIFAALAQCPDIAFSLIKAGADLSKADAEGRTPLMIAIQYGSNAVINAIARYCKKEDFLCQSDNGYSLLHACTLRQETELAGGLFKNLLNKAEVPFSATPDGVTPLHLAAFNGQSQIVALCCEAGWDVNVVDAGGNTPLHCATFFDPDEVDYSTIIAIVKVLIAAGAAPSQANHQGQTAIGVAKERNMIDCVELMSAPSSVDALN